MKPYPEYKPTGLAWLPEIPRHWTTRKIKYIFRERSEKGYPDEPLLAATQNHGVIPKSLYGARTVEAQKDLHLLKLVRVGDFVISLRSFQGGIEYAYYQGIISPAYTIMIPDSCLIDSGYFRYLAKSPNFIALLQTCVTGIREGQNIDYSTLRRHSLPLPPADEQAQIVRYLDAMTAKINKLIRAKKTVNELIMEQLIEKANRCVNDKKLKRYRLKNILTLVSDEIDRKDDILYSPVGVLNRGRGVFHKPELLGKELGNSTFFHVYPGDMIFSGQFAWEGAVGILQDSEKGCIASHRYPLARAVDPDVLKLEYLWAFFQTKYGDMILNTHSYGAAGRNRPLNIQRLLAEDIPLPSIAEQNDFVILFRQLQKAKLLATKYTKQLQDYKDALIAAVVTGKVDVRNIVVEAVSPEDLAPSDDPDESEEQDSTVPEDSED